MTLKGRPVILSLSLCGFLAGCRTPVPESPPVAAPLVEELVSPGGTPPPATAAATNAPAGPEFNEYLAIDDATADDPVVTERVVQTDVSYPIGLIGAVEPIFILGSEEPFRARVDTGATTSSVDAENIQGFERDGREWVSFEIVHRKSKNVLRLELPVKRRISIKRQEGGSEERFVVDLTTRIGGIEMRREFSLADRGDFEYSVLIGRNVLRGMAVVDVAQQNVLD